jgi:uncharacterized membrane protein YedE/YeeE
MDTVFTPWQSLAGGALIGLASTLLMLMLGRIMGATGILAGLLSTSSFQDSGWRLAILLGMISGPVAVLAISGQMPLIQVPVSTPMLVVGGFIVGIGVTYASGCTSGHGVCGIARLSRRSIVATAVFMIATGLTVYAVRHLWGA